MARNLGEKLQGSKGKFIRGRRCAFIYLGGKTKMSLIAKEMMVPGANDNDKEKYLTQKLELLVGRRDQIAHESDMSYTEKREITQMEVEDAITFIDSFVACVDSHV